MATELAYQSGFGNGFETEALPGALPIGRNSPQKMRLRPLRRAAQRLALHGAARQQRALLAVPHPADGRQLGPLRQGRRRPVAHGPLRRGRDPARTHALGPDPAPVRRPVADRGHQDHHHRGRRRQPGRHGGTHLSRHPLDGERVLLQRRRRDDVRAPAGRLEAAHRVRRHRRRSRRGRGDPARRQVQRRAARTGPPAVICARTTAAP